MAGPQKPKKSQPARQAPPPSRKRPVMTDGISPAQLRAAGAHVGGSHAIESRHDAGAATPLEGSFQVLTMRPGLVLRRADVRDCGDNVVRSTLTPGLKLIVLEHGDVELEFGHHHLHLQGPAPGETLQARLLMLTQPASFMRRAARNHRERSITLTASPEWLRDAGLMLEAATQSAGLMPEAATTATQNAGVMPEATTTATQSAGATSDASMAPEANAGVSAKADAAHGLDAAGLTANLCAAHGQHGSAIPSFLNTHLALHTWPLTPRGVTLAQRIARPPEHEDGVDRLMLESRCLALLGEGLRHVALSAAGHPASAPAGRIDPRHAKRLLDLRARMDAGQITGDGALADLAAQAGLSVRALQQGFQALTGTSAVQYLRTQRLKAAQRALLRQGISVSQAATLAGYTSAANFATAFKRLFGVSPRDVRMHG